MNTMQYTSPGSVGNDVTAQVDVRAYVDPLAYVGAECVVQRGAYVGAGVTLEQGVYVGANAVFASLPGAAADNPTLVRADAWIGANATISAGVVVGARAMVRPGAVVTRSVPPAAIVEGNPAQIVGYVGIGTNEAAPLAAFSEPAQRPSVQVLPVHGVTLHHFPVIQDLRGLLTVGEFDRQIPFVPRRYFLVYDVPSRESRGEHAHRSLHEFLICLRGSCAVVVDDGHHKVEIALDRPDRGLYLPPMTWRIHYKYTPDAMLLVFASHLYDPDDYIREYDTFLATVRAAQAS
jgi:carbonic anhydrase/acetyltransferase-like protein (isoleucine patch superfamily)